MHGIACGWLGLGLALAGCDAQVDPSYQGEPLVTIHGRVEAPLSVGGIEVGLLWFRPANDPFDAAVECTIEPSGEAPSACVVACGSPSCADLARLEAWDECAGRCDGPTGVSLIIVEADGNRVFQGAVAETTPVEGAFPSQFQLDLRQPPPAAVLSRSSTGERLALALFVALDPAGAPFELDLGALPDFPPWLLGGSGSHVLTYAPDGVPAGSQWSTLLELELDPGFRLVEVARNAPVESGSADDGTSYAPAAFEAAVVRLIVADPATIDWPLRE